MTNLGKKNKARFGKCLLKRILCNLGSAWMVQNVFDVEFSLCLYYVETFGYYLYWFNASVQKLNLCIK